MYDIIGDVHGHAAELIELLERLGYREINGAYSAPGRIAVFVGDLIDRGPGIRDVLRIVRGMHDRGTAHVILGNHEFNALAYHTTVNGRPLREHSDQNIKQHSETLRQVPADELRRALDWFRRLPIALDLGQIRVVHACWDPQQIRQLNAAVEAHRCWNQESLRIALTADNELFYAVEDVLKGKEQSLPGNQVFRDANGHQRSRLRVQWYRSPEVGETFASYALPRRQGFPETPLPARLDRPVVPYSPDDPPVFFGHYWLRSDTPAPLATNVACLDFSVAKAGRLCAYRWDGERSLSSDKFVQVPAR